MPRYTISIHGLRLQSKIEIEKLEHSAGISEEGNMRSACQTGAVVFQNFTFIQSRLLFAQVGYEYFVPILTFYELSCNIFCSVRAGTRDIRLVYEI